MRSPLARLDWRFLVPLRKPMDHGTILLQGGPEDVIERGRRADLGERLVTRLRPTLRLDGAALLLGSTLSAREVTPHLKPGGFLWQEMRVSGAPRLVKRTVDGRLEPKAPLRVTGRFAVWPDFESAEFHVSLDSPECLEWFLRTEYPTWTPSDRARRAVLRLISSARPSGRAPFTKCFGVCAVRSRDGERVDGRAVEPWRASFLRVCSERAMALRPVLTGHGHARAVVLGTAPGARRPGLVAKLSRSAEYAPVNRIEQERLEAVRRAVDEPTRAAIPDPLGCVETEGRTVALERHVPGRSMVRLHGSRGVPRRTRARHLTLACDWLARFHRQAIVAREVWSARHIRRWVREPSDACRSEIGSTPDRERLFRAMRRRAEALEGRPFSTVWCHGDFTPWNLRLADDRLYVTDWEGAGPGPALRDLVHLITHWNELAQRARADKEKALALRRLLDGGAPRWIRRTARRAYDTYLEALDLDPGFVGLLVCVTWVELSIRHARTARSGPDTRHGSGNPALALLEVLTERRNLLLQA